MQSEPGSQVPCGPVSMDSVRWGGSPLQARHPPSVAWHDDYLLHKCLQRRDVRALDLLGWLARVDVDGVVAGMKDKAANTATL